MQGPPGPLRRGRSAIDALRERLGELCYLVGNTPMLAIECEDRGRRRVVFAKAENLNMTESMKDRMALYIVRAAYDEGALAPGAPIAEATSGSTGVSFSAIGRALGHPVVIFMPDWVSHERKDLMRSLGAEVYLVSKEEGGVAGCIERCEQFAAETPGCFLPRQFANEHNVRAHEETTGPEILSQLAEWDLTPDAFVAGVGTGGTVMGVGRYLRRMCPSVKIHPLEPTESPTLSTGCPCRPTRIQGISGEFIPPIIDLDALDEIITVDDGDAILMAQKLAGRLGLGVGISSGANLVGALRVADTLPDDAVVVTCFPDSNKKYLSTDLMREEPAKPGYRSPEVDLLGFRTIKRSCAVCGGGA